MREILQIADNKNIQVIGYFSPFPPSIYQALQTSGHYGYFAEAAFALERVFEGFGFAFFDFTDAAQLGGSDTEFWDSLHPTEPVYDQASSGTSISDTGHRGGADRYRLLEPNSR